MTVQVPLRGSGAHVEIRFSAHAVERYAERVKPSLPWSAVTDELQHVAAIGAVHNGAPDWWRRPSTFPHLVIGDVCFPLDRDRQDPSRLIATTCLCRGMKGSTQRRRRHARHLQVRTSDMETTA